MKLVSNENGEKRVYVMTMIAGGCDDIEETESRRPRDGQNRTHLVDRCQRGWAIYNILEDGLGVRIYVARQLTPVTWRPSVTRQSY